MRTARMSTGEVVPNVDDVRRNADWRHHAHAIFLKRVVRLVCAYCVCDIEECAFGWMVFFQMGL